MFLVLRQAEGKKRKHNYAPYFTKKERVLLVQMVLCQGTVEMWQGSILGFQKEFGHKASIALGIIPEFRFLKVIGTVDSGSAQHE